MDIKKMVESYHQEILDKLSELISYNSVQQANEDNTPFGKENAACLNTALKTCEEYGFKTKNLDNYIGYGEVGTGEQCIGILGHLDVVPAGEGWDSDPFVATIKNDKVYGRGSSDDKGCVVAAMVALKIVTDLRPNMNKRIRLIMGCNEESGSRCLAHYVEKEGHIDMGFTPDGSFPGIHGEKGGMHLTITSKNTKIISIQGGVAGNVVCNKVNLVVPTGSFDETLFENFLVKNKIEYSLSTEKDGIHIAVKGVAAHASTPEEGINAISYAMVALHEAKFNDDFVSFYADKINLSTNGERLNANLKDEYGALTFSVGLIGMEGNKVVAQVDIRFPVTMNGEAVSKTITDSLHDELANLEVINFHDPLYYPIDSPLVKMLSSAYYEVTKDTTKPMTMGGGTYAKGINNAIAFGGGFPGHENVNMHNANEFILIEDLYLQTEIYVHALLKLLDYQGNI